MWLEVIRLRSAEKNHQAVEEVLESLRGWNQREAAEIMAYRHIALKTDWMIVVRWDEAPPERNGSTLGLHLEEAFRELGLVDHGVWKEKNLKMPPPPTERQEK
jgi:hypothetical protein